MYTSSERLPDPVPQDASWGGLARCDGGYYRGYKTAKWTRLASIAIDWWPISVVWGYLGFWWVLPLIIANQVVVQGYFGGSVGKLALGQRICCAWVDERGQAFLTRPGYLRLTVRLLLHVIDSILAIGVIRMLFHIRGQTPADTWAGTVVFDEQKVRESWASLPASAEDAKRDPVLSDWTWRWHLE